jgi:hypothetical protein
MMPKYQKPYLNMFRTIEPWFRTHKAIRRIVRSIKYWTWHLKVGIVEPE